MTLSKYLLTSYGILLVMIVYLAVVGSLVDENLPTSSILITSPFIAAIGILVNIYPSAMRVPQERRTSFLAYRAANARHYVGLALLVIVTGLAIAQAAGF